MGFTIISFWAAMIEFECQLFSLDLLIHTTRVLCWNRGFLILKLINIERKIIYKKRII